MVDNESTLRVVHSLEYIAECLERIATALEKQDSGKSIGNTPVEIKVDSNKLVEELTKRYPNFQQNTP